jgi:hypothetical protein
MVGDGAVMMLEPQLALVCEEVSLGQIMGQGVVRRREASVPVFCSDCIRVKDSDRKLTVVVVVVVVVVYSHAVSKYFRKRSKNTPI